MCTKSIAFLLILPCLLDGGICAEMVLNENTFFLINKMFPLAKLGNIVGRDYREYSSDQLWHLKKYPTMDYYYLHNAEHKGRLVKSGNGDNQLGTYSDHTVVEDQLLWRFQKEGDYYAIYNKKWPSARLAVWGNGSYDWGTRAQGELNDTQLWKLVPRFTASATDNIIRIVNNSCAESQWPVLGFVRITVGMVNDTQQDSSRRWPWLSTGNWARESLMAAVSAGVNGINSTLGKESNSTINVRYIQYFVSTLGRIKVAKLSNEAYFTCIPADAIPYKMAQTVIHFESPLTTDSCNLYLDVMQYDI